MKRRVFALSNFAALGAACAASLHAAVWHVVIVWLLFNAVWLTMNSGGMRRWLTMTRSQYPHH